MYEGEEGRIKEIPGVSSLVLVVTDTERLHVPSGALATYGVTVGDRIRFHRIDADTFNIQPLR